MTTAIDFSNVQFEKGFIQTVKPVLNVGNIRGVFIYSIDYLTQKKEIITARNVFDNDIVSGINQLNELYGNFHLNYLIHVSSFVLENELKKKFIADYKKELNCFTKKFNLRKYNYDNYFDRNVLFPEFTFLNTFLKRTKESSIKIVFVNQNLSSQFFHTFKK